MNIQYNQTKKSIEIKDKLKNRYLLLKLLMIVNLVNAVLNLSNIMNNQLNYIGYLWIFIGALSFGFLLYLLFKKTTVSQISIEKISSLKEKMFLGRQRFSLELTNGKFRDLTEIKTQSEIEELKKIFSEIGIKTS